jgi:hypothetical protein
MLPYDRPRAVRREGEKCASNMREAEERIPLSPFRTCSTEAEIRRHCAFEASKKINSGDYKRISLVVSAITHT